MIQERYQVLDTLIEQGRSFAIYRLPGESAPRFLMQESDAPLQLNDIEELNGKEGFVIAPFHISDTHPILLIRPDLTELPKISGHAADDKQAGIEQTEPEEMQKTRYDSLFDRFQSSLLEGRLDKIVLSRSKTIPRESTFSAGRSFEEAMRRYIYSYVYLFHTPQTGTWLGSSPEILLTGKGNEWNTIALAGTRYPNTNEVSWDTKNLREQSLVTYYLRRQLTSLQIEPVIKGPYTIKAGSLAHLRTDFRFRLPNTDCLGSLLKALHPTPAVSGLPKNEAYAFIRENEGYDRLYYSGFLGLLAPQGQTHIYVNLRCMQIQKSSLTLFAGGGLLPTSTPEEEWEETEQKLQTMLGILK